MGQAKHTPGPWEIRKANRPVDGAYDWAIGAEIDGGKHCIAEAFGRAASEVWLPAESNAHLIAAAPDLLKALESLLSSVDEVGVQMWDTDTFDKEVQMVVNMSQNARAAIAKAKGE